MLIKSYRKAGILLTAVVLMMVGTTAIFAPNPSKPVQAVAQVAPPSASVDVVHEIPSVSDRMKDDISQVQKALARIPASERNAYMKTHYPNLTTSVAYWLRLEHLVPAGADISRIDFAFGSLDSVTALERDGRTQDGHFTNQIIAMVFVDDAKEPKKFILECMNGLVAVPHNFQEQMQSIGSAAPQGAFTIGRHEGLIHHVDFLVAVDLAERFHLKLYRGSRMNARHRITPAVARTLQSETDRVQVTVKVARGDRFDLNAMTYTPASPRHRKA